MTKSGKRLTEMVRNCGCAAKLSPGILSEVLSGLDLYTNDSVITGISTSDDAGAYRLADGSVLLQTVDFFPANSDDPYIFGQISAANAMSDIYAMGGTPVTALNIVCFPAKADKGLLKEILRGGADKAKEAGAVIIGGHSVEDPEPKYGLAVTGLTDEEHLSVNCAAHEGDTLILTKPIGTGIIVSAVKGGVADKESRDEAVMSMTALNRGACEAARKYAGVHACTDVTGFSLAGHSVEMAKGSGLTIEIDSSKIPLLAGAAGLAEEGIVPQGTYRNREHFGPDCEFAGDVNSDLIFDPQTSGGLLISVAKENAEDLLADIRKTSDLPCAVIGRVIDKQNSYVAIK